MANPKVLIIDDEVDYCMIMKSFFLQKEYQISLAYTLQEGLNMIESFQPDILFLDNNLPDGKGWPHLGAIVEKNPQLRVYLVSAYHQKSDFASTFLNVTVWEKPLSLSLLNEHF